ncbi:catechol 1,2-dioxygenase [Chondrinema litorale]|uniref:catechol 1,2-dioxygenase n=1 Tax=Chondrinema litorale TaxID=2994555 RepID=UPI002542C145|nr:catechol 1,2-dioxygenase [Chondrinema litorale]UZR96938.1 catechol 1,2-dioxygenase [Chondrinema litorale]
MERSKIDEFLKVMESTEKGGNERVKQIVNRIVKDLFYAIDDFNVTPDEFWTAINYLTEAGQNQEWGLIAPGLGFEHFLDMRLDEEEEKLGIKGGTPRTIEGPLYVAGAPEEYGFARLDDGTELDEAEIVFMQGQVKDENGNPVANARVEVWHANLKGNYSYFDSSQSDFNLRRSIITDENGRYQFRSIMPSGYSVPPKGSTEILLDALGRHGHRPAHIHFFISAEGFRKLTTQINIEGDPYLWDDFAFASREGLVPAVTKITDEKLIAGKELDQPYSSIDFDFSIQREHQTGPKAIVERKRAELVESKRAAM